MTALPAEDAAALAHLPRCTCGAPAMAFRPGTEAESAAGLLRLSRAESDAAWCVACWAARFCRPASGNTARRTRASAGRSGVAVAASPPHAGEGDAGPDATKHCDKGD